MNKNSKVHLFIKALEERKLTLAMAESMTCGLAAHTLSTCKGTSNVFMGSIVCYNEKVKTGLMGIKGSVIKKHTAESREITRLMVLKLKKLIGADIYAAVTGLASAGGSEGPGKPVGTVFFAVGFRGKVTHARKVFRGSPLLIREKACMFLYELILKVVNGK